MRMLTILAVLALASPLPVLADGDVYRSPKPPGTVTVYRGGSAGAASSVIVHRGSAIRPAYLAAAPLEPATETVGGRDIWFVDRAENELTSCRVINTFNIGDRRVRCARAALPD